MQVAAPSTAAVVPVAAPDTDCVQVFTFEADTTDVSAPASADGAVFVATVRERGMGPYDLVLHRASLRGDLTEVAIVASAPGFGEPRIASNGQDLVLTTFRAGAGPEALVLTPSGDVRAILPLPSSQDAVAVGPRGLVGLYGYSTDEEHQSVIRLALDGSTSSIVRIPRQPSSILPWEQLVASGEFVDLVVTREAVDDGFEYVAKVLPPDADSPAVRHSVLRVRGSGIHTLPDASVAAGPSGFLVVTDESPHGPSSLTVHLFDGSGARSSPPVRHEPTGGNGAGHSVRFARAVAHRDGWVVSYWDGIGISLLALDPDGRTAAPHWQLRSGDERGSYTDGRMSSAGDILAVTWDTTSRVPISTAVSDHGWPGEPPKWPGPRLALVRCPG